MAKLIIISGFSGAGKGTIVNKLMKKHPEYALSVSATTRRMRAGEVDGKSYFFITKEEFEEKIKKDDFLEYANYVGNYYGTPKSYVLDQISKGNNVILEIEQCGALQVKEKMPEALLIFIITKSKEILKDRLKQRGSETEETIEKRLKQAEIEALKAEKYDYIIINDDLDKAINEISGIIENGEFSKKDEKLIDFIKEEFGGTAL